MKDVILYPVSDKLLERNKWILLILGAGPLSTTPFLCSSIFDLICCYDEICVILYEMESFLVVINGLEKVRTVTLTCSM